MSVIENLDIVLGAKTQQLDRDLLDEVKNVDKFRSKINGGDAPTLRLFKDKASGVLDAIPGVSGINSAISNVTSSLGSAAAAAGPVGIAIAGAAAIATAGAIGLGIAWSNVSAEMKRIDEISDSAQKLSVTFRDLSTIRFSFAESTGMDPAGIDAAVSKMSINLAEANTTQTGSLFDSLTAAGLDAGELLKMGPAKALDEISRKTSELKSPTDQLVLSYELFGKAGASMVVGLREGPEALKHMADWADKTRVNLTQAQAEGVGAANDAWGRLEMVATGLWRQVSAESAPVLEAIYTYIADGTSEFSHYLDYLPAIVDGSVMFAGTLYDAYEAAAILRTTLDNIVSLNWSEVGKDVQSAFTFDTGAKALAAVQAARDAAANKSRERDSKSGNVDSELAAYERKKEKEQELAAIKRKTMEDQERADKRAIETVQKRFDAASQEIDIQQQLLSMSVDSARAEEQNIRERFALEKELREVGKLDQLAELEPLLAQVKDLKKQNENRSKAADLSREFAAPQEKLIDKMAELDSMRQQKLISEETFTKASKQAYDQAGFKDGPRGAVSVQAKSVEAYKLLLEMEKGNKSKETEAARIRAAQLAAQLRIAKSLESGPVIRAAR